MFDVVWQAIYLKNKVKYSDANIKYQYVHHSENFTLNDC